MSGSSCGRRPAAFLGSAGCCLLPRCGTAREGARGSVHRERRGRTLRSRPRSSRPDRAGRMREARRGGATCPARARPRRRRPGHGRPRRAGGSRAAGPARVDAPRAAVSPRTALISSRLRHRRRPVTAYATTGSRCPRTSTRPRDSQRMYPCTNRCVSSAIRIDPGFGHRLHPRRDVRGVADGGVVHAEVVADPADHDRTRVDTDAQAQLRAVRRARAVRRSRGSSPGWRAPLARRARDGPRRRSARRTAP